MKYIVFGIDFRLNQEDKYPCIVTSMLPYSEENLEIAKAQSYNGKYAIEDIPDEPHEPTTTTEQRVSDLEEQIVQADETAIALYEAQEAQEVINTQQDEALMEIYEMIG